MRSSRQSSAASSPPARDDRPDLQTLIRQLADQTLRPSSASWRIRPSDSETLRPSDNLIRNCDSCFNAGPPENGNTGGFAPKLTAGSGNSFCDCRAWRNSDDGRDGYLRGADDITTNLGNCWSFEYGYPENHFQRQADQEKSLTRSPDVFPARNDTYIAIVFLLVAK